MHHVELKHLVHIEVVATKRERLLGKGERNINADCRGHDSDRPRQLPRTKPILYHTTGIRCWEKSEEGLGVLIRSPS